LKPPIQEIAENFYMITLPMPFRLKHVNIFAIVHDGRVALFDTGLNLPETFSALEASLDAIKQSIKDIDRIFLTHFHADHCGIAGRIKEISNAVIYMPEIEYQSMQNYNNVNLWEDRMRVFCIKHGLMGKTADTISRFFTQFKTTTAPFEVDVFLEPQQFIIIGNREFEVIETPGHTRGHVCFFCREEGILLSGDHVLPYITPNLSPDLFAMDFRPLHSFLDSLTRINDLPVTGVYPAHGLPFSDLDERVEEIKEHHGHRKELILDSIKGRPKTAFEVSLDIFGRALPEFDKFLALNETYVHLIELEKDDLIKQSKRDEKELFEEI